MRQRLATAAGIEMLATGGTAADAVVAADAVLGVVQPMSTGLGGDATCIVALDGSIEAYQGTGAAGAGLDHGPLVDAARSTPATHALPSCPASSTCGPMRSAATAGSGCSGCCNRRSASPATVHR